jgi:predicted dehydrogenase
MRGKKKLNVGVIGLGWPGLMHSEAIVRNSSTDLYAIADLSDKRRAEFLRKFPVGREYKDYTELLADPNVDAVIVSLPNYLHARASIDALKAAKHVLCEKPPTINLGEMVLIRKEAEKSGLVYAFGRQNRFSGQLLAARKAIESGRLGEIYYAKTWWYRSRGIPTGIDAWFTDKKRSGGGAIIDIGIHTLDNAWFLMGAPRPVSVSAQVFQKFARLVPEGLHNDVDDCGFAFIKFENGAVISLETTWAANLPPSMVDGWNGTQSSLLFGTKASLSIRPLRIFADKGHRVSETPLPSKETDRFLLQLRDFAKAIKTGGQPTSNARQALDLMLMLDAIYKSSETGREVRITRRSESERSESHLEEQGKTESRPE